MFLDIFFFLFSIRFRPLMAAIILSKYSSHAHLFLQANTTKKKNEQTNKQTSMKEVFRLECR